LAGEPAIVRPLRYYDAALHKLTITCILFSPSSVREVAEMKSKRLRMAVVQCRRQMKRILLFVAVWLVMSHVFLVHATAEQSGAPTITAYFSSRSFDVMDIDSSLIIASPFEDCIAISIRVSYPNGFPNDDIACFRAYLNDLCYEIKYDSEIPMPWSAPSVFYGLIPFDHDLQSLRIVPVGSKEMEEWADYELSYLDYQKQE